MDYQLIFNVLFMDFQCIINGLSMDYQLIINEFSMHFDLGARSVHVCQRFCRVTSRRIYEVQCTTTTITTTNTESELLHQCSNEETNWLGL